jgi:hypothetical protein
MNKIFYVPDRINNFRHPRGYFDPLHYGADEDVDRSNGNSLRFFIVPNI